jgi:hypothetical protein
MKTGIQSIYPEENVPPSYDVITSVKEKDNINPLSMGGGGAGGSGG